jgi:hypothetical protein
MYMLIFVCVMKRLPSLDEATQGPVQAYFRNTLQHIRYHQTISPEKKYEDVALPGF